ncbi:MAG TPA: tripartite tricarboxylate transporter permease [Micropepsaceae bacterium]|jgi:putative tricarboxylic transport membrane protein|nr:tripartite tricarboxylate transporter permease [Micropepsaceae bacterium]
MLDMWLGGLQGLLHIDVLLFVLLGMVIGLVFGAIPGLGGTTAIALLMPLTYGMEPFTALALAGGVMGSVPMGGSITSILLNTPGTAPNAATCLDGHPLAQQGKAGLAIGAAGSANALGAIIGTVSVLAVLPIASDLVLLFGPPEFFLMGLFALAVVATTSHGKALRGLVAGGLGLMIAFVGYNDIAGGERFTFGVEYLWDGIHLVPALIGLFAVAEMIHLMIKGGSVAKSAAAVKITSMTSGLVETFRHWPTVLRGSFIGTTVGAIPGLGGTVVAFLSYSVTAQASKNPESFGKGNIQGVIAPEAAICAHDCSALIPTLTFGIPAGAEMAVFMGLLIIHGMQPGPLMLRDHQVEIYGLIWALTASCVLASFVGLLFVRPLSKITLLDSGILVPLVLSTALAGSFAIDMTIENVVVTAVFGVLGYMMMRYDYPRLMIVVALVLGGNIERNFHQSMLMGDGGWSVFFSRTISIILMIATVAVLLLPVFRGVLQQFHPRKVQAERGHS